MKINQKVGFYAAVTQTIIGYLYYFGYIIFMILFPPQDWTNIQDFAIQYTGLYKGILILLQILVFAQSFTVVFIALAIFYEVKEDKKILAHIGVIFGIVILVISSAHYYIQLTTIRLGIENNTLEGLELWAQFNFDSPISVINIMGWTLFFGISNSALGFCFNKGTKLEKWIRWGLLTNGSVCIITSILFALNLKIVMVIWIMGLFLTNYVYPLIAIKFRNEGAKN